MRWIIRIIVALLVVAGLGLAALFAIPSERIADLAADRIGQATDRRVTIAGSVRPTLYPYLGVRAEGLEIGNPDWVDEGPLLAAEALNVGVNWAALFAGEIRLEKAEFDTPRITLVRGADGRESWDFSGAGAASAEAEDATPPDGAAPGGSGPAGLLGFDLAEIRSGALRFVDRGAGQDLRITDLDAALRMPQAGGAATLTASGAVNGAALETEIAIDGIAALLEGGVQPVTLALGWSGGEARYDGVAGLDPLAAEGEVSLDASDLGPLLALAGGAAPDLPEGLGRDRIAVSGELTYAPEGTLHLRGGQVALDETALAVELDFLPGDDRPRIRGTLAGQSVDLSALAGGGDGGAGAGAAGGAGGGWPRDPIDVGGLFAADAELAVRIAALDLGVATLDDIDLRANLEAGRLVLDARRIGAFGGAVTGNFVVNGRGGLSMRGDLDFAAIRLNPLLQALAGYDRLEGTGDMSLEFLGVGNDIGTLMSGLDGAGQVRFGAGAILGFDLAGMIRNFDASYRGEGQRTVYDSITASFQIADGLLSNEDLQLDAPWGEVTGAGRADLGGQTLDYRVIPGVMRGADGVAGIRVPILISGPWSDLSFRPDLEYLAEQELAEERARLAEEARQRLEEEADRLEEEARQRANEALGTDIEAGQTREEIEEQLEDRLRREAEEQLRRLLGQD